MHISDIKKYLRCPKLLLLSENDSSSYFSFFNINIDINDSIASKLKIKEYGVGQINDSTENTLLLKKKYSWVFKARFVYKELRIKAPLIHFLDDNHLDLYNIYLVTSVSHDECRFIKYICDVIEHNGFIVDNVYNIYLNKFYQRDEQLDSDLLWICNDIIRLYGQNIPIIEHLSDFNDDLDLLIDDINILSLENATMGKCSGKKRCSFYETCYPETKLVPDNSILTLASSQYKHQMYEDGILYLKDVDYSRLEGNNIQKAQIRADLNGGLFFNKKIVSQWVDDNIKFPLSFIDFEWDLYPIPPYKGMKPLDVGLFQYSLHVYDGNELKHYQYIGKGDCRKELAYKLLNDLPKEGSVIAYNALGAEKIRIEELASYYPDLANDLLAINKRMVDLAWPFINGHIYDVRMRGAFTLKVLEDIIDPNHSYHQLECDNGLKAVELHRQLEHTDVEKEQEIYNNLFEYCGLDSYSLFELYKWLKKQLDEK